jgi:hypothetical protein
LLKVLELFFRCQILVLAYKWKFWCGLTRCMSGEWYLFLLSTKVVGIVRWDNTASSVWSVPPPARWGNSVLNAAFCPRDQLQNPPPALFGQLAYHIISTLSLCAFPISAECWWLLLEVVLLSCPHSHPLLLYLH